MSQSELDRILARASTLWERLQGGFEPAPDHGADRGAGLLLDRWCRSLAGGRMEILEERLARDGTSSERVRACLGSVRPRGGTPHPPWFDLLARVWGRVDGDPDARSTERFLSPTQPVPFQEVLIPFVLEAREQLAMRASCGYGRFVDRAHGMLERGLLQLLSRVAATTLQREFVLFRQSRLPVTSLFSAGDRTRSRGLYDAFILSLRGGRLREVLVRYAMLSRLLSELTRGFIDAQAELMSRFDADAALVAEALGSHADGRVIAAEPYLSDLHDGGRTVTMLHFEDGSAVVYKPRSLELEAGFYALLEWLQAEGSPEPFKVPHLVSRPGYGWVRRVMPRPWRDQNDAACCYRRAGALLAVLYVLDCTDAHLENVMMDREGPVLVDAETVLEPRLRSAARGAASAHLDDDESVLRTEFLPGPSRAEGSFVYAGLLAGESVVTPFRRACWLDVNSDEMTLGAEPFRIGRIPDTSEGRPAPWREPDPDQLVSGFRDTYRFLLAQRGRLLAPGSPLEVLKDRPVRFVWRPSGTYGALLQRVLNPRYLESGAAWSVEIDSLARMLPGAEQPALWPLLEEERIALERLDTPRFTTTSEDTGPRLRSGVTIDGVFKSSSFELMLRRLSALDEKDLHEQIRIIRASLEAMRPQAAAVVAGPNAREDAPS